MEEKITALYIRLSLEDVDKDDNKTMSTSVHNQSLYLWNYIMKNPSLKNGKIQEFIDDGYTGTNMERPALMHLLELVKKNQVECIIVKDVSRFGRNYIEVGSYLEQIFPCLNVRFISVNDQYDSWEHKGDVLGTDIVFKNIIYDYCSKELSQKVLQSKRNLAKKGFFMGGIPPFGYIINPNNKHQLLIDYDAAKTIRRIFQFTLDGETQSEIARRLNGEQIESPSQRLWRMGIRKNGLDEVQIKEMRWSASAVRSILKNPVVIGSVTNHRVERKAYGRAELTPVKKTEHIVIEDMHEAIIETEVYHKVQSQFAMNVSQGVARKKQKREYPLSGLLTCGCCGRKLAKEGKGRVKYVCKHARVENNEAHKEVKVKENVVMDTIKSIITVAVRLQVDSMTEQTAVEKAHNRTQKTRTAPSVEKQKRMLSDSYEQYVAGEIDKVTFLKKREEIQKSVAVETVEAMTTPKEESTFRGDRLKKIIEGEEELELTQELAQELIREIKVFNDTRVEISWKFKNFLSFT